MSDPFDVLREDSATPSLPAADVRTRGDRLRRRRTTLQLGAAAASVAAVAVGGALAFTGHPTAGPAPGPATSVSSTPPATGAVAPDESPPGGWLTTLPGGLSLTVGLPNAGGDIPAWRDVPAAAVSFACTGHEQPDTLEEAVAGRRIVVSPPAGAYIRQVILFRDHSAARVAHTNIDAMLENCPASTGPGSLTYLRIEELSTQPINGPDRDLPVTSVWRAGGDNGSGEASGVPGRELIGVTHQGNAVLITEFSDEAIAQAWDDPDEAETVFRDTHRLLTGELCRFSVHPCEVKSKTQ